MNIILARGSGRGSRANTAQTFLRSLFCSRQTILSDTSQKRLANPIHDKAATSVWQRLTTTTATCPKNICQYLLRKGYLLHSVTLRLCARSSSSIQFNGSDANSKPQLKIRSFLHQTELHLHD